MARKRQHGQDAPNLRRSKRSCVNGGPEASSSTSDGHIAAATIHDAEHDRPTTEQVSSSATTSALSTVDSGSTHSFHSTKDDTHQQPSLLMSLPKELRDQIWTLVIHEPDCAFSSVTKKVAGLVREANTKMAELEQMKDAYEDFQRDAEDDLDMTKDEYRRRNKDYGEAIEFLFYEFQQCGMKLKRAWRAPRTWFDFVDYEWMNFEEACYEDYVEPNSNTYDNIPLKLLSTSIFGVSRQIREEALACHYTTNMIAVDSKTTRKVKSRWGNTKEPIIFDGLSKQILTQARSIVVNIQLDQIERLQDILAQRRAIDNLTVRVTLPTYDTHYNELPWIAVPPEMSALSKIRVRKVAKVALVSVEGHEINRQRGDLWSRRLVGRHYAEGLARQEKYKKLDDGLRALEQLIMSRDD